MLVVRTSSGADISAFLELDPVTSETKGTLIEFSGTPFPPVVADRSGDNILWITDEDGHVQISRWSRGETTPTILDGPGQPDLPGTGVTSSAWLP